MRNIPQATPVSEIDYVVLTEQVSACYTEMCNISAKTTASRAFSGAKKRGAKSFPGAGDAVGKKGPA